MSIVEMYLNNLILQLKSLFWLDLSLFWFRDQIAHDIAVRQIALLDKLEGIIKQIEFWEA